jgi:hypothetical protein
MDAEEPSDTDQRIAERTALRKVRKLLEMLQLADSEQRRALRNMLIVCAVLFALGAWALWALMFSGRDFQKGPPIELPGRVERKA